MNDQQFSQIVAAIADGKYSWACILILRFTGYNPALYMPYRTYKRLLKENTKTGVADQSSSATQNTNGMHCKSRPCYQS